MAFQLSDLFPEHHTRSEEIKGLLDSFYTVLDNEVLTKADQLVELKNPDKFPIDEFREAYERFVDFNVPQVRDQSDDDIRNQLKRVFDWVSIIGSETAVVSYFNSIGFLADTEIMMSDDYQSFTPVTDLAPNYGDYFFTPHVEVTFTPQQGISGEFFNEEIWNIIQARLDRIYPLRVVPHHIFEIEGYAEDFSNILTRGGVTGVTHDNNFQVNDPEEVGKCHEVGYGLEVVSDFTHSDAENISKADVGRLSSSPTDDTTSLDTTLYTVSDFSKSWNPEQNSYEVSFDMYNSNHLGEDINAVLFYDNADLPVATFKFPTIQLFDADLLEFRFTANFIDSPFEYIRAKVKDKQSSETELNNVYTFLTSNYDKTYDDVPALDLNVQLDRGVELDTDAKIPYFQTIDAPYEQKDNGYWVGGDLSGYSGNLDDPATSGGDIWNPLHEGCRNFELFFRNNFRELVFETEINKTDLWGKDIEQIGIYDQNDNLIIHSQFEPFTVGNQDDRQKYRLVMEVDSNI